MIIDLILKRIGDFISLCLGVCPTCGENMERITFEDWYCHHCECMYPKKIHK